jgi:mono/diheme cytochrome c family protein
MSRRLAALVVTIGLAGAFGCGRADSDHDRREGGGERHESRDQGKRGERSHEAVEQGSALYKKNCAACHGETGKGDGPGAGVFKPPPRDHTDRAYMSTLSDKDIADVIKMGGAAKGKPLMPSHPQFKDHELRALVTFVRSLSEH